MKLKNVKKRIARLTSSIAKDTKKLAKLQRKLATALRSPPAKSKSKGTGKKAKKETQPSPSPKAAPAARRKKKRHLSPEGRAKLRALMKERWAAKRAAGSSQSSPAGSNQSGDSTGPAS